MIGQVVRRRKETHRQLTRKSRRNGSKILHQARRGLAGGANNQCLRMGIKEWQSLQRVGKTPPFQSLDVDWFCVGNPCLPYSVAIIRHTLNEARVSPVLHHIASMQMNSSRLVKCVGIGYTFWTMAEIKAPKTQPPTVSSSNKTPTTESSKSPPSSKTQKTEEKRSPEKNVKRAESTKRPTTKETPKLNDEGIYKEIPKITDEGFYHDSKTGNAIRDLLNRVQQQPYQLLPRLGSGEVLRYFRDRPEHAERHEHRGERHEHDTEGAERQGRRAPSTGVESGLAAATRKPHGGVESTEDVDAQLALNAAKFGEKGERALSAFEKALVARFEKGEQQATNSEDGQFHFLKKTAAEWKGFFENFLSRTIQKVVTWGDVQGFLFRGLLQAKGMPQQGVMISDVMTAAGVDKFARIAVPLNKAQALAATLPGAMLTKEAMRAVVGEQLRYAALAAAPAEEGAAQLGRAATRGMFASQQLENRVAEQLGLITDFRGAAMQGAARDAEEKRAAASRRRRGGMWAKLFGGDEVEGEGSVFIHWWRWDREERGGFRRWFVAVFGAVIFVALFFLIIALVRALRP